MNLLIRKLIKVKLVLLKGWINQKDSIRAKIQVAWGVFNPNLTLILQASLLLATSILHRRKEIFRKISKIEKRTQTKNRKTKGGPHFESSSTFSWINISTNCTFLQMEMRINFNLSYFATHSRRILTTN